MREKEKALEEKAKQLQEEKNRYGELSDKLAEANGHNRVKRIDCCDVNVLISIGYLPWSLVHRPPDRKVA